MKRRYIIGLILSLALLLTSCEIILQPAPTPVSVEATPETVVTQIPLETQPQQITPPPTAQTPTAAITPTTPPVPTIAPQITPNNSMSFYSCYAHMVSYNPSNNWAEFDYFYLLQGQAAIDYLVDHEGWSQTDAENHVNAFADSEFIEQNNNTGLRTIDLDTVPVRTIINTDGSVGPDLTGSIVSMAHINNLYAANPNNLLNYIFYYIECDASDNVIEVRQVFWP